MKSMGNPVRRLAFAVTLGAAAVPSVGRGSDDGIKALTKAYNGFGQDVLAVLGRKPGNIVFSPYSVGVAMAMVMSSARGDTQSEMLSAMRFTQRPSEIEGSNVPLAAAILHLRNPWLAAVGSNLAGSL